jgi:CRISPR/Cas system-associated exonuclease Cas4 (RecB family)
VFRGKISFSAFECYSQCPFKFKKLYIERITTPNNEYAMYGSAFHELLDTIYSTEQFLVEEMLKLWPAIFLKESSKNQYSHISSSKKRIQENRGVKDIRTWFKMAERERILRPCLEHEVVLNGSYRGLDLKAKVDLVIEIKGGVGIIDWKTGNADRKNLMQLALYATLYYKRTGRKVDWLIPFYTKTKDIIYQPCDKDIIEEAGNYFSTIYNRLMQDSKFEPTKNTMCYFCDFGKTGVCPLTARGTTICI